MIVEDEPLSRLYLSNLLAEAFPQLEVVATASNEQGALDAIQEHKPELLFLDIELQGGSGFGVVTKILSGDIYVIFTTALDQHATCLLQLSGVPYIQKPIDLDCLTAAVTNRQERTAHQRALAHLNTSLQNSGIPTTMLLDGSVPRYIALDDIIAIEAVGKQCRIHERSGQNVITTSELKDLDDLLSSFGFFRLHIQFIINRAHVLGINEDGSLIKMRSGICLPVSQKKLAALSIFLGA
jgi:two-component system LytT family response regulator